MTLIPLLYERLETLVSLREEKKDQPKSWTLISANHKPKLKLHRN